MAQQPAKVLLIGHDAGDIEAMRKLLGESTVFELVSAPRFSDGLEILASGGIEAVLLDRSVPDSGGLEQDLLKLQSVAVEVPVLVLSDAEDRAAEVNAVARGAQDFLIKQRLTSRAIERILLQAIERQRAHSALEKAVNELRRVNQLKTDFISSVSHELHTPLTVITVAVNNFIDGIFGPLSELQLKWMDRIKSNADRLTNLINDILDLSKLESGRAKLNWKKFDLAETARKAVEDIGPLAQEKKIRLSGEWEGAALEIYAAQNRIEQVIVNLITNAIKYTPAEGKVTVRAVRDGDQARVQVEDTGMGVDPSKLDLIFERFLQLGSDKTTTPGIGLGLAICKEILLLHDGKIWAESAGMGKGSRFVFTLPAGAAPQDLKQPTVLVVDNDPAVLDLFQAILEDMKYRVILGKDGAEGMAQIVSSTRNEPIDLLIVDLLLPVRNGTEVIKEMKRVNPKALIMLVTGYPDSALLTEAMLFCSFTLLKKPFEVDEIRRIVGSLLAPQAARAAAQSE